MNTTPDLPDEILLNILSQSVAFHSIFNHSLLAGPNSTWARLLRHKKSIVLVCKRWNRLATPLLYREVFLRRGTQIQPFVYVLSNSSWGGLVEELTLTERCSIEGGLAKRKPQMLVDEDVQELKELLEPQMRIFRMLPYMCHRLKRLSIRTLLMDEVMKDILSDPILARITQLSIGESIDDVPTHNKPNSWLFEANDRLRCLSIHLLYSSVFPPEGWRLMNAISFPALEELRISQWVQRLTVEWSLPKLKRLTIVGKGNHYRPAELYSSSEGYLRSLLEKNGREIDYLAIFILALSDGPPLEAICASCPRLEHLVLEDLPLPPLTSTLFPSVKFLDLYPIADTSPTLWDQLPDRITCFPSLESVNFIWDRSDLETFFFLFPAPPGFDVIQLIREAYTWLTPPGSSFQHSASSLKRTEDQVLVRTVVFAVNEMDPAEEPDSEYSPSTAESSSDEDDSYPERSYIDDYDDGYDDYESDYSYNY